MPIPNTALQFISTTDQVLGTSDPATPNGAINRELYKLMQNDLNLEDSKSARVANIAALKALTVTNLTEGATVIVQGYASKNDGGGGVFFYVPNSVATTNIGTVFAPDVGSGRWFRIFSTFVDVRWFGAKGDGSTDDRTAVLAAIAAIPTKGQLWFPATGDYFKITDTVTINVECTVILEGEVRSTDKTKVLFLVTWDNVTFDFRGGALRGPGDFNQTTASGVNYGALIEFRGVSTGDPVKNCKLLNPRLIDPPWAGIYFRYVDGWQIHGGTSTGGPATQTGTQHFVILAFDSTNWVIDGFENRPSSGGGTPVQVFNNTHSSLSDSPGIMTGCRNLGSWDKLIYQTLSGAIVVGNSSLHAGTNARQSIRTHGKTRVAHNIVEGGILVTGPNGADVSHNRIEKYDYVGIQFSYVGGIGANIHQYSQITNNVIIADTPGGAITEIYEGIRIQSDDGTNNGGTRVDIDHVKLSKNTIIGADMCSASAGGNSAKTGAISINSGKAYQGFVTIEDETIIGCGAHAIAIYGHHTYNAYNIQVRNLNVKNCASDGSSDVGYGVKLISVEDTPGNWGNVSQCIFENITCYDNRGAGSRLSAAVFVVGSGQFKNTYRNCVTIGAKAGEPGGVNIGDPFGTNNRSQCSGNAASGTPLIGQFTLTAGASFKDVVNDAVIDSVIIGKTLIKLTPMNVAAVTLQHGHEIWVSSITPRTGFRVQTYDGTLAAGTEIYQYEIIQ